MSTQGSNVIGLPARKSTAGQHRSPAAQGAINTIASSFKKLIHEAVRGQWTDSGAPTRQGIVYGAYNQISFTASDGTVTHACGSSITEMRDARAYTRNAVELRCDALGLAIYVSSVKQIDPRIRKFESYLRVASYQYKKETPELGKAYDPAALYAKLHTILISTYNQLSREYNLAGLNVADLTLVSDHPTLIPNVVITEPC
ncbi:hypothetical protein SJI00_21230 [Pseudomonas sp. RP23018S]|uniref:hypothetical protein n=1 Tax=Pseudomonas sp. RP23018S TaxID=3096037 RepID=UPI002ACAABB6|nr:hypothetical protein [Pseudomonas sp. RP23018S]MDZ5605301.1 hypothetical protein [Pseudomonas sp. RP23018S]